MLTDELVEEIKREEGFMPVVYLDARSKKTIGYGTLLEDGISEAEAELLLRHRLALMGRELEKSRVGEVYENLRPGARRAVLNMAYNMGVPNLLGFRKMWAALAEGDYARAAAEACATCHDDPHTRAYFASPHRALWQAERDGRAPPGSGVSCATCHMPKTGRRGRIATNHNQNDNLRPNEKMIRGVCLDCHGLGFALDALADAELVERNFRGRPQIHVESIEWAVTRAASAERKAGE